MVSIIIPIYNVEEYLCECVNSVLAQTYSDIQVILVNDGSTDNCGCICEEYKTYDRRVVTLHKNNGGLSDARNAGLDIAGGEYLFFVDADDYIREDAVEKLVSCIERENADFLYFDAETVFKTPDEYGYKEMFLRKKCYYTGSGVYHLELLLDNNEFYPCVPMHFYKKTFLKKYNIRFEKGIMHEDELFSVISYMNASRVAQVKDPLYFRRIRPDSLMSQRISVKSVNGLVVCINKMLLLLQKYPKNSQNYTVLSRYIALIVDTMVFRYSELDTSEKKHVGDVVKGIKISLSNLNYLDNRRLKIIINANNLYSFYIKRIKPIKPILVRLRNDLFLKPKTKLKIKLLLRRYKNSKNRVFIIATPTHGNLGDQAIVYAEKKILKKIFDNRPIIEISNDSYVEFPYVIQEFVKINDVIIVDGGGNLGTIWDHEDDKISDIIRRFKNNRIIVFPQSCFYDSSELAKKRIKRNYDVYSKAADLSFMLRDYKSYSFFIHEFPGIKAYLVPDIVLSMSVNTSIKKRSGALLCLRKDSERIISVDIVGYIYLLIKSVGMKLSETTTVIEGKVDVHNRFELIYSKFVEFSSARVVITDRLHAMIFCAITGTPCLAFDNLSNKVSGCYEWIKELDYIRFISNMYDIKNDLEYVLYESDQSKRFVYPFDLVDSIVGKE